MEYSGLQMLQVGVCRQDCVMERKDMSSRVGVRETGLVPAGVFCIRSTVALSLLATSQMLYADEPPLNDHCLDAIALVQGQHEFSNIGADTDGPLASECSTFGNEITWNDVWFRHVADEDGILVVSTCGTIDYDSRLSIYSGSCSGTELIELACNDDAPGCAGYSSIALVECLAGEEYLLRVGSYIEGMTGSGSLGITITPPCFEHCTDSSQMELEPCGMATNDGCNSAAYSADSDMSVFHESVSLDVSVCGTWFCDGTTRDTDWYYFDVPEPGAMVTTTLHSSDMVVGYLYMARVGCPLEVIDYQYGGCPTIITERWLTAGVYRAIVAPGFESIAECASPSSDARYELLMKASEFDIPFPVNDDCADATMVGDGSYPFTNYYSTTDGPPIAPPECSSFGPEIGADVWFAYEASCTGRVTASVCGQADFDTRMEVWSAGCDGVMLACNDDGPQCAGYTSLVEFEATCGETYHLRIAGYQGARGQGVVDLSCDGSCCSADIDGDGLVSGSDLASLLGGWNSTDPKLDLNGDGTVNGADLAVLLGSWGVC